MKLKRAAKETNKKKKKIMKENRELNIGNSLRSPHFLERKGQNMLYKYALKKVVLGKQRMHRRTVTKVCIFSGFGHLGLISDPLIVSKFHNETHDPKGQENKIYTIVKGRESSTAATQSLTPAVVKSNMFFFKKGYPLEAKNAPKNCN